MSELEATLPRDLEERLGQVRSVGVITGAGVSQESGIPTYRGAGGIYDDPEEGDRTVEALSAATLASDPDLTWRELAKLARAAASARPNAAHRAVAEIERKAARFVLLTQNVDGLHQSAGSRNVIDIHGNIAATRCLSCGKGAGIEPETLRGLQETPRCAACRGPLRPDVVLFGEFLSDREVVRLEAEFHARIPDLVIAAGTSALFPYIVKPVFLAQAAGKLTVEINLERTELSEHVSFHLRGRAGDYLPLIAEALA